MKIYEYVSKSLTEKDDISLEQFFFVYKYLNKKETDLFISDE